MIARPRLLTFQDAAAAAFPFEYRAAAERAAAALLPFVDDSYRKPPIEATVLGRSVHVPSRLHFQALNPASLDVTGEAVLAANCLCTRSTDGHLRQAALRDIVRSDSQYVIPFVVLLAGEYVVEIIDDLSSSLPMLNRLTYSNFVRENRPLMRRLRSRAMSYWNQYYRAAYANPTAYPGLLFLHEIERWAA